MKEALELNSVKVTGTMVSYYFICKRKLWLFAKGLDMEDILPTDDVLIGRLLNQQSFKRKRFKEVSIGDSIIDFLEFNNETFVHEVKKSPVFEEAHIWQVKYYIYLLRKSGFNTRFGVIHYPKKMRKVDVEYLDEDDLKIEKALKEIVNVLSRKKPPPVLNRSFCKKCAYYEFCYI